MHVFTCVCFVTIYKVCETTDGQRESMLRVWGPGDIPYVSTLGWSQFLFLVRSDQYHSAPTDLEAWVAMLLSPCAFLSLYPQLLSLYGSEHQFNTNMNVALSQHCCDDNHYTQ